MNASLNTALNLAQPDDVYEALINLHRDLTPEQSRLVNAKLILLLINHVGDRAVIEAAFARARAGLGPDISGSETGEGLPSDENRP